MLRHQFGIYAFDLQPGGYSLSRAFIVARKHYGAQIFLSHPLDQPERILPDHIRDEDVSGIFSVRRDIDNSSRFFDRFVEYPLPVHQTGVSDIHVLPVHACMHTVSRLFFNIRHTGPVQLFSVRLAERQRDRMVRIGFRKHGDLKKFLFLHFMGNDLSYVEHAFCQRSGFIKYKCIYIRQFFKVGSALDEHALLGRGPDPAQECHRDRYHQTARAGRHKNDEPPVDPLGT